MKVDGRTLMCLIPKEVFGAGVLLYWGPITIMKEQQYGNMIIILISLSSVTLKRNKRIATYLFGYS